MTAISPATPVSAPEPVFRQPSALTLTLRYLRRNKSLVIGLLIYIGYSRHHSLLTRKLRGLPGDGAQVEL